MLTNMLTTTYTYRLSNQQTGIVLLEGLISILIFSLGILALVSLQGTAVKQVTDAKYRADAGLLADQLLGMMWVSDRSTTTSLQTNFDTSAGSSSALSRWQANVANTLPGITTTANQPTVTVTPPTGTTDYGSLVEIKIYWHPPSDPATAAPHQYITTTQIK
jgi:type IV pilus assembly protein PilV